VAFVSSHALQGGAERHLFSLIERLGPAWTRTVITLAEGPLAEWLREADRPLEVIAARRRVASLAAAWPLRRSLQRLSPALVHADGIKAALLAVIATAGTDIPVLWFKVDYTGEGWRARTIARRCAAVVGISAAVTDTFTGSLRKRVSVVPCGIPDYESDRGAGRALVSDLLGCPADATVILHLGRLRPSKGAQDLVEIAPSILERRPDARILLLPAPAEGAAEQEFELALGRRIDELELEGRVALLPGAGDPVRVLSGCDLVVVSSMPDKVSGWREGFGLVGAEAMAVGTPVAGYADGALPEVLGDCARLVPTGDKEALRAAIEEILDDEELRGRLVTCGKERVKRYRLEHTVELMKDRYRDIARAQLRQSD
jgi:glycosyltransferase involved in cell wall biosynthesis